MKVANNWAEVSLKQYIEITDISQIDMDELDKQIKVLAVLSNTSEELLCAMELSLLKQAIRGCQFIYTKPPTKHIKQSIKIGGHRFNINTNLKKISGGEYIDLTSMIKEKSDVTKNLPKIIAIFLHPVNFFRFKKKSCYEKDCQTLESRNKTAKIVEDKLMMDDVMMLSGFFLKSWQVLAKATLDYSELQTKKARKQLKKIIAKDSKSTGDGI